MDSVSEKKKLYEPEKKGVSKQLDKLFSSLDKTLQNVDFLYQQLEQVLIKGPTTETISEDDKSQDSYLADHIHCAYIKLLNINDKIEDIMKRIDL